MKKILLVICLTVLIFGCKKDETKPATQISASGHYDKGYFDIYVNSNYVYPYLTIERGGSAGPTITRINENTSAGLINKDSVMIHYKLNADVADKYRAYTQCSKNTIDTTKNMLDNKKIWNRLIVVCKGDTIYNEINSTDFTGPFSSGNVFDFDVK